MLYLYTNIVYMHKSVYNICMYFFQLLPPGMLVVSFNPLDQGAGSSLSGNNLHLLFL